MKIQTENQQPAAAQEVEKSAGRESGTAGEKGAASKLSGNNGDRVELSGGLDAELKHLEAEQAQRVEALKARIAAGEYQVDARAVAEKLLAAVAQGVAPEGDPEK